MLFLVQHRVKEGSKLWRHLARCYQLDVIRIESAFCLNRCESGTYDWHHAHLPVDIFPGFYDPVVDAGVEPVTFSHHQN